MNKPLIDYLNNKDIAIVGNAKSIFDNPHDIDSHEVIIRMNMGIPITGKEKYMGSRTDIIAYSLKNLNKRYLDRFGAKFIFYCTNCNRDELDKWVIENGFFYDELQWEVLHTSLEARPSTGCMVFDFLMNDVEFKKLHLYGFDWMKTPNWYTKRKWESCHNYEAEKEYITFCALNDERIIIHE